MPMYIYIYIYTHQIGLSLPLRSEPAGADGTRLVMY